MKRETTGADVHRRLKKIAGQVNAIDKMVEEGADCEAVLIQINAARSALRKVGQLVLEQHLDRCVREGVERGDAEGTVERFSSAIEHFSRMN